MNERMDTGMNEWMNVGMKKELNGINTSAAELFAFIFHLFKAGIANWKAGIQWHFIWFRISLKPYLYTVLAAQGSMPFCEHTN